MTVVDRIRERANEFASNPAVIEGDQVWTHAELWDRVDRLSHGLIRLGAQKGEIVMAWLPNCHEAIEAELACLQIGAIWVSVNSRFTPPELEGIIADCDPRILITDNAHLSRIQLSTPETPKACKLAACILLTGEPCAENPSIMYEQLIESSPAGRPAVSIADEDIARLRYTSGTTGKAKAAILPHRVYLASLKNLKAELHPLDSSDRVLHAAPLTHASGAMLFPILAAGGANVLLARFDPEEVLERIERDRITTMFIVPTILTRLAESPGFSARDLASLRTIMYGGAPTAVEKLTPVIQRIGHTLVHIYGMTEAPYPITTLRREEHWIGNPRLGSIGKPTAICSLKIVNESGEEVEANDVGEIHVRGENVMRGYWKDDEETQKVLRDEWLASGDLARRDEEGYTWIVDRKKDVIISGGFNVYAREVEDVLCSHPDIAETAVVGAPHRDWGEIVVAYVVPKSGALLDPESVHQWCRARLASYKCPKRLEILDELPKTSSGKIQKKALADR